MELNWKFQRGGGSLGKIPSLGEVWIISGTTHCRCTRGLTGIDCQLPLVATGDYVASNAMALFNGLQVVKL